MGQVKNFSSTVHTNENEIIKKTDDERQRETSVGVRIYEESMGDSRMIHGIMDYNWKHQDGF